MKRIAAAALALMMLSAQTPVPRAGETIEVSIFNVDVRVTDKHGNPVHGLTKDDFVVLEDGQPQPITNFAEYDEQPAPASGNATVSMQASAPVESRQKRTIVLFIDRFHIPANKIDDLFSNLKAAVHRMAGPDDTVAVVAWVHRLYVRQPFTSDLTKVDAALDDLARTRSIGFAMRQNDVEVERQWEQQVEEYMRSGPGGGGSVSAADSEPKIPMDALAAAAEELADMKAKSAAMSALLDSLSAVEGQKAMICLTRRWSRVAGWEYLRGVRSIGGPATSKELVYSADRYREAVERSANAAKVNLYMLYPAGLDDEWVQLPEDATRPGTFAPTLAGHAYDVLYNEMVALVHTAEVTGGATAWGQMDVIKMLPAIERDLSSYYSLAYRATTARRDRVHRVEVKVKNPAYRVRARQQVVEQSDATLMKTRVAGALYGVPESMRFAVQIKVGKAKERRKQHIVPLDVYIPVANLTTLPENGTNRGAFTVFFAASDIVGGITQVTSKTQPFNLEDARRAKNAAFQYHLDMITDDLTYRVAVGVLDEVSHDYALARADVPH